MESFTAEAHRVDAMYQAALEHVFVCFLVMLWKGNGSHLPVTGQSMPSPFACGCPHRGGEGAERAVPTEGWEARSWRVHQ